MELTAHLTASYIEPSLNDMLRWAAHYHSGMDALSAARDNEQMHVGATYASGYLNNRPWNSIRISEVACLHGFTVADCVEPDLDEDGKAGIARTVANLVARARTYATDLKTMLLF